MERDFLFNCFIFLAAACIVVPLAKKFRLGAVLGYLVAGVLIGKFGIGLIDNAEEVMHFAEFGIIMMLFMIGLELEPAKLWKLRKSIVGLGGLQVLITSIIFTYVGMVLGYDWKISLSCSMALSLSSTALVLQMLQEKGLLHTSAGESSFAVLLFQDISVIPILVIMPLLGDHHPQSMHNLGVLKNFSGWLHALIIASVITIIVVLGRYLSRYLFNYVAKTNLREVFTAISLAVVVGVTLVMQIIGVSPALGAFIAGVVLANSEYKHTLETDLEPFKGLLLGLFFISVGMGIDFTLFEKSYLALASAVAALVLIKITILYTLGKFFGLEKAQNTIFAFALAQGSEFAFVLFQYANGLGVVTSQETSFLVLVVTLSMVVTPLLMIFNDRFIVPCFLSMLPKPNFDVIKDDFNSVIIAGYGRFGHVVGRFLSAQGVKLTILEKDPDQIELLRKFGNKVYFGDASRIELLRSAGAAKAKLLIVAVDEPDKALEVVQLAKKEFKNLKIFARARNRRHAYELQKSGADYFRRELFDSSLVMAQEAMKFLGKRAFETRNKAKQFMLHDEKSLNDSFAFFEQEPELINFAKQAQSELERVLQNDIHKDEHHLKRNEGWGN